MAAAEDSFKSFLSKRKLEYSLRFPFLKEKQIIAKLRRIWSSQKRRCSHTTQRISFDVAESTLTPPNDDKKPEIWRKLHASRTEGKCSTEASTLEVSDSPTNPPHAVSARGNNQLLLEQTLGSPGTSFHAPSSLLTPLSQEDRRSLIRSQESTHSNSSWTPLDSQEQSPGLETSQMRPSSTTKHPLERALASNASKNQLEEVSNSHPLPRSVPVSSLHGTSKRNPPVTKKVEKIPDPHLDGGYGATTATTTDQQHCWQLPVLERSPEKPHPPTRLHTPETHNHRNELHTLSVPDTLDDLLRSSSDDNTLTIEEEEDLKEKLQVATPSLSPVLNSLPSLRSMTPNADKLLHRRVHRRAPAWRDRLTQGGRHLRDSRRRMFPETDFCAVAEEREVVQVHPEQTGDWGGSEMNRRPSYGVLESPSSVSVGDQASPSGAAGTRSDDEVVLSNENTNREVCSRVGNVGAGGESVIPAGSNVRPLYEHVHMSDCGKEESDGSNCLDVGLVAPILKPQKQQGKCDVVPISFPKQPKKPAKHKVGNFPRRKSARIRLQQEHVLLPLQQIPPPNQPPSSSSHSKPSATRRDGKENRTPETNTTLKSGKRHRGETSRDSAAQVYPVRVTRRVTALQNAFLEECLGENTAKNLLSPISPRQQELLHTSNMEFSEPVRVSFHCSSEKEVEKQQESIASTGCSLELSPDATVPSDSGALSGPQDCVQVVPTESHSPSNIDSVDGEKPTFLCPIRQDLMCDMFLPLTPDRQKYDFFKDRPSACTAKRRVFRSATNEGDANFYTMFTDESDIFM